MPLFDLKLTNGKRIFDQPGGDETDAAQQYANRALVGTGIGVIATRPAKSQRPTILIGTRRLDQLLAPYEWFTGKGAQR